jgi:hypothetical protein
LSQELVSGSKIASRDSQFLPQTMLPSGLAEQTSISGVCFMHVKRLAVHVVEDVNDHFADFRRCKNKWGIHDDDVSNFNESGFPIGVTTSEYVIVPIDCTVVY